MSIKNILFVISTLFLFADSSFAEAVSIPDNPAIRNMLTRQSVRDYTVEPVSEKELQYILKCAMQAPSAVNEQPWEFVIITDSATLEHIGTINPYASFAKKAPLAILVCLNQEREKIRGMGILDVGLASENILLAAHSLGLGAVFTGIYPDEARIRNFQKLASLPANVIPIGLIVLGHPERMSAKPLVERYQEGRIHREKWQGR